MKIVPKWQNRSLDRSALLGSVTVVLSGCGMDFGSLDVLNRLARLGKRGCATGGLVVWIARDDYGYTCNCECRHCRKLVDDVLSILVSAGNAAPAFRDVFLREMGRSNGKTQNPVVRPSRAAGRR